MAQGYEVALVAKPVMAQARLHQQVPERVAMMLKEQRLVTVRGVSNVTLEEELLILLHSHYADFGSMENIQATTKLRNSGSVGNKLRDLVGEKLAVGDTKKGYKLTRPGFDTAVRAIQKHSP
jgi:hypothetical protein